MKEIDKAIVLRKVNYSETSLILTTYTNSNGLQSYIFQGGKKRSNALYPMSLVEIEFYKRPDSDLGKLTNIQSLNSSSEIPFHPLRSTVAFFMADVLYQCLKTDQADAYIFEFLERQIEELDESNELGFIPLLFLIRLSKTLGIEPIITHQEAVFFVPIDGEFRTHHGFGAQAESGEHVQLLMSIYQDNGWHEFTREKRNMAFNSMLKYFEIHIPAFDVSRSLEVLKEILE